MKKENRNRNNVSEICSFYYSAIITRITNICVLSIAVTNHELIH